MQLRMMRLGQAALVLAALWSGCAPGGARAAGTPAVRLAYQDRVGSVIPLVAVRQGFFKEAGVDVAAKQFNNGPACAEALYSGAVDVAAMGDTAALLVVARHPGVVMLASHATGEGRHRVMVKAGAPETSLAGLKGKRIGVKKGTSTYGGLLLALGKAGMTQADVTLVDLDPPAMAEALAAGSIDAFAASEPTPSVAETRGARQLADLSGLGNDYPIMLLARSAYVTARRETLGKFFAALAKAQAWAAAHPEETAGLMAETSGLPLPAVRAAMARHAYALRLDAAIVASLAQTADFLVREHILDAAPDFTVVVDRSFVR